MKLSTPIARSCLATAARFRTSDFVRQHFAFLFPNTMANSSEFRYQPLENPTSTIRLITILPGHFEDELLCRLADFELPDRPDYPKCFTLKKERNKQVARRNLIQGCILVVVIRYLYYPVLIKHHRRGRHNDKASCSFFAIILFILSLTPSSIVFIVSQRHLYSPKCKQHCSCLPCSQ